MTDALHAQALADKARVRAAVAARLDVLSPEQRAERDRRIRARAHDLPELRGARTILAYAPLLDEVDLWPLIETLRAQGNRLAFARVHPLTHRLTAHAVRDPATELAPGHYGLREPSARAPRVAAAALDAVLVPGRAFTAQGARVGRGGGYYDRFLARCPATRIAFAYAEQIFEALPCEAHDLGVHVVVTSRAAHRAPAQAPQSFRP